MKLKIFDVVELKNKNKATILEIDNTEYKVEIVNINGESEGIDYIEDKDIKKVIFSKLK